MLMMDHIKFGWINDLVLSLERIETILQIMFWLVSIQPKSKK